MSKGSPPVLPSPAWMRSLLGGGACPWVLLGGLGLGAGGWGWGVCPLLSLQGGVLTVFVPVACDIHPLRPPRDWLPRLCFPPMVGEPLPWGRPVGWVVHPCFLLPPPH